MKIDFFDNKKNGYWILATILVGLAIAGGSYALEEAQSGINRIPVANFWATIKWVGVGVFILGFAWLGLAGSNDRS